MKLDFGLQMQQEQKLVMTQQLQLAVKLLQLSSYELNEYIDEQLMENPLLEIEEKNKDKEVDKQETMEDRFDQILDYLNDDKGYYSEYESDDEDVSPFNFIAEEKTLWDYLKEQLFLVPINGKLKKAGEYIIDSIDENGYLTTNEIDIAIECNISQNEALEMIKVIQGFDPAGICARNIHECLILQLENMGICNEIFKNIAENMLEDVGENKISKIAKSNNISQLEAQEYVNIIRKLDPKPGIRFCSDTTRYIVPDVYVEKIDGKYAVTVNEEGIPQLKVSRMYKRMLQDKSSIEYKYVKEKMQSALWLLKSIDQRIQTIKKVVESIIEYQIDFFENDTELKPLTLKQIADTAGFHESTVSRAVKGKYVQTPKGTFEIKNFFIRGIQSKDGEEIATLKIKKRIKELIDGEDHSRPYSDQQLSDILKSENLPISRRTVAKYREETNIPPSSKRKR